MSARKRVALLVASAAVAAAAVVVAAVALQGRGGPGEDAPRAGRPGGSPPLFLEPSFPGDRARALLRGEAALRAGRRAEARRVFAAVPTPEGRVALAVARWPDGTVPALLRVVRERPSLGMARVNLGLAFLWSGRPGRAAQAWRDAMRRDPDSFSAVRADDLLHPRTPAGLPEFVPSAAAPAAILRLGARAQLAALRRAAAHGGARERILYGVALQRVGRPVSAQREYAAAARAAPGDVEALTADAVGRFRKSAPTPAFSRLGPLTKRFPRAATVRFHLGLLLLWLGDAADARRQLLRARALGPRTTAGRQAQRVLRVLDRSTR